MVEVRVKDFYAGDTISKNNSKAWELLMSVLNNYNEEVLFDFYGVNVYEPWLNNAFLKFIGDPRVYMRLYSSRDTANSINIMCRLNGIGYDKCFNEELKIERPVVKVNKRELEIASQLQNYFVDLGGVGVLEIYKRFDQLGSLEAIKYIRRAIEMFCSGRQVNKIVIDTGNISVLDSVLKELVKLEVELLKNGIDFEFRSLSSGILNNYNAHKVAYSSKDLSIKDKLSICRNILVKGTPGMLVKYKKTKAIDEFGRYGKGEPVYSRACIFKGYEIDRDNGKIILKFRTFNSAKFYPKVHWMLENDGEILEKLDYEDLEIDIRDIGVCNAFFGRMYHFELPIQSDPQYNTIIYDIDSNNKVIKISVTVPMRIKMVFDSWGINYKRDILDYCIEETNKLLGYV